ncbi:uncharacterized protein LOC111630526 [Centruroides sculpturatus]|uniref:uncharacterized protein LOC111630526 n=1 Tax=Centruroides sculpturatus TaxID=218467 RepID=UPI000C6E56F1|nr:uncharacterized protein LOC111630526 [Centruroides sculpturatus]
MEQMSIETLDQVFTERIAGAKEALDLSRNFSKQLKDKIIYELDEASYLFKQLRHSLEKVVSHNQDLEKQIENSRTSASTSHATPQMGKQSYAEVVKRPPRPSNDRVVLIYPKENGNIETVMQDLEKDINPTKIGVGIEATRKIRNGYAINCNSSEGAKRLSETLKTREDVNVRSPGLRDPRIILPKINWSVQEAEIKECLLSQGSLSLPPDHIKHVFFMGKEENQERSWVAVISPELRRQLAEQNDKLFMGWSTRKIHDFYYYKRCSVCWRYGHTKATCSQNPHCSFCASEHHASRECQAEPEDFHCINCLRYNASCRQPNHRVDPRHTAWSRTCPVYKYQVKLSIASTRK